MTKKMRVNNCVLAAALLVIGTAADCAVDDCLQVIQDAASALREEDCESFVKVTITPATSTIFSTTAITTTGSTTRTTTQTVTSSLAAEPSKRWLERHEVVNILMGRAVSSGGGPVTVKATAIPSYASLCTSFSAYESACSCLGISPTTVTASTPCITQVIRVVETTTIASIHTVTSYVNASSLLGNSTSGNSTGIFLNTTSSAVSSSLKFLSSSDASVKISSPTTASTDKFRLKSPSIAEATSSTETDSVPTTTSSTTSSLVHTSSATGFSNSTDSSSISNATASIGIFLNSTSTSTSTTNIPIGTAGTVGALNATSAPFLNSTQANATISSISANFTSTPLLNSTSAPFLNLTQASANNTAKLWPNSTLSALLTNTTNPPFLNNTALNNTLTPLSLNTTTKAPFLNTTSPNATSTHAPFANTTSSLHFTNTTSTTATPTETCQTTTNPFALQVAQPNGPFNNWYLRLSGSQALFNPSQDQASQFSFDTPSTANSTTGLSHLCSLDNNNKGVGTGANASAVVAIAEDRVGVSGSAVYFVAPGLLAGIEGEERGWYAPLECRSGGSGGGNGTEVLNCEQGGKEFWVGCGLGLDITSDGDGEAVVDGWNCTGVTLSIVYSS